MDSSPNGSIDSSDSPIPAPAFKRSWGMYEQTSHKRTRETILEQTTQETILEPTFNLKKRKRILEHNSDDTTKETKKKEKHNNTIVFQLEVEVRCTIDEDKKKIVNDYIKSVNEFFPLTKSSLIKICKNKK